MINNIKLTAIALFALFTIVACSEDDTESLPISTFTINSPEEDKQFNGGDTILIDIDLELAESIHGYSYLIRNTTTDSVLLESGVKHIHGTSHNITDEWINKVTEHSDLELEVNIIFDHDGVDTTITRGFHVHPITHDDHDDDHIDNDDSHTDDSMDNTDDGHDHADDMAHDHTVVQ